MRILKYLLLAAISGTIITADQAVKMYIHTHFRLHEEFQVIPGFFNLTYVRNPGAAFGFLSESHPVFREIFFLSMPPVALLIILAILRGVADSDRWTVASLSLVFGGATGNYIDRLRFRYVIDFLDFHLKTKPGDTLFGIPLPAIDFTYPAFNIADVAIVCGVMILLFLEFTKSSRSEADETTKKEEQLTA